MSPSPDARFAGLMLTVWNGDVMQKLIRDEVDEGIGAALGLVRRRLSDIGLWDAALIVDTVAEQLGITIPEE